MIPLHFCKCLCWLFVGRHFSREAAFQLATKDATDIKVFNNDSSPGPCDRTKENLLRSSIACIRRSGKLDVNIIGDMPADLVDISFPDVSHLYSIAISQTVLTSSSGSSLVDAESIHIISFPRSHRPEQKTSNKLSIIALFKASPL